MADTVDGCVLCSPDLAPLIVESSHWRLILNRNQCRIGACMLVLRRHQERVTALTSDEWTDLYEQIRRTTAMLAAAFQPDHFNYAFLQNQDRHVHLHVIPRYAGPRDFAGLVFSDTDYPDHYTPNRSRSLTAQQMADLAQLLGVSY